jgi:hypothetical protein
MLANGKKQVPTAVSLVLTGADGKRHVFRRSMPGVAGRVDPFIVPLPAGSRYSLLSPDLGDWFDQLGPGRYRVGAEFVGEAFNKDGNADMAGHSLMTYWTGTLQSDEGPVTLPARPAR